MRVKKLIVGVTVAGGALLLSACGGGVSATSGTATSTPSSPAPTTTTTTVEPTTTTPPPPPPPPAPATTSTSKTTPKPTTTKPKPKPAPPPSDGTTPCSISDGACIDLSANKSWLLSGGKVTSGPNPITHGRPGYRTPPGTFRVSFKDIDHKSSIFNNAPMPYSVFFHGGIAFHAGSLREPSHGCIHLSNATAKVYYNALAVGATVQVVP